MIQGDSNGTADKINYDIIIDIKNNFMNKKLYRKKNCYN